MESKNHKNDKNHQVVGVLGVVGVSSRLTQEELEKAVSTLEQEFLLTVKSSSSVLNWVDPEARAQEFLAIAFDKDIDFLLCARGGEGCADMMPFLQPFKEKFKAAAREKNYKILSGMSDNTPLLLFLAECGWPVFYGPVASIFARALSPEVQQSFECLLKGNQSQISLTPLNQAAQKAKFIEGEVTGGNLTLLNLSLKESWEFDATDKILMLEDWHEKAYAIDRVLKHFERIGKFSGVKSIILGNFIGDLPSGISALNTQEIDAVDRVLKRFADRMEHLNCPVFESENIGHVAKMQALKFGKVSISQGVLK
jgi:muramoyltetrapeptide carboxypeptidase